ncbi:MAG: hypothetical protein WC123_00065 [Bacilli bacterium]|nr:hypothetical protein [Bacilli bacterium]
MKLKKRNMRQFDYLSRVLFCVSVVLFVFAFIFLQPMTNELKEGNYLLNDEIAQISTRNETLKRDIEELLNPTTTMSTDNN